MPAWSKFRRLRTSAMAPIDGMTASHASASMPPGSQPDSRSHEKPPAASAAAPRWRRVRATLIGRHRVERGRRRERRQHRRVGHRVVVVTAVEQVLEQRRLRLIARRRDA